MLYLAFLGLTRIGVEHKVAMSFLYFFGVLLTFVMNKKWTFSHDGHLSFTIVKYISLYIFGYLINLGVLILMVDWFRYPYDWVQGVMVPVLAVMLFIMQKSWVFSSQGIDGEC